ncbi:cytochrome P450 [Aspergillus insuetus]
MRLLRMETARKWDRADEEIASYAVRARDGWAKAGEANRHRVDILSRIEQASKTNPETALSDKEVIATMMEILNAGSDTTANTAMFAAYELAKNPEIQEELHQELVTAFPDPDKPLDFAVLERLPILDGVCREALRIHAPIPSYLERVIAEDGVQIEGYDIPKGTVIGMQAYTNHRDPLVYPHPEAFVPQRWFAPTEEMKTSFLPFSAGPRACIGLNLANMQLRIHLGHIFHRYRVALAKGTNEQSMKHVEFFMVRPVSQECNLNFKKYKT